MELTTRAQHYQKPPARRRAHFRNVEDSPFSCNMSDQFTGRPSGAVTVFQPISYLVLRSLDAVKVSAFTKEQERYDLTIEEKKAEISMLTAVTDTAYIDSSLLRNMYFLGKLDNIAPTLKSSSSPQTISRLS